MAQERILREQRGRQTTLVVGDRGPQAVVHRLDCSELGGPSCSQRRKALECIGAARLPRVVSFEVAMPWEGCLEVVEAHVAGLSLGQELEALQQQITVPVALALFRDIALALEALHKLEVDGSAGSCLIHGRIGPDSLVLTEEGGLTVVGFEGIQGDPYDDIDAVLRLLQLLLAPRGRSVAGRALLERLGQLQFHDAVELREAIDAYLDHMANTERVDAERGSLYQRVLFESAKATEEDPNQTVLRGWSESRRPPPTPPPDANTESDDLGVLPFRTASESVTNTNVRTARAASDKTPVLRSEASGGHAIGPEETALLAPEESGRHGAGPQKSALLGPRNSGGVDVGPDETALLRSGEVERLAVAPDETTLLRPDDSRGVALKPEKTAVLGPDGSGGVGMKPAKTAGLEEPREVSTLLPEGPARLGASGVWADASDHSPVPGAKDDGTMVAQDAALWGGRGRSPSRPNTPTGIEEVRDVDIEASLEETGRDFGSGAAWTPVDDSIEEGSEPSLENVPVHGLRDPSRVLPDVDTESEDLPEAPSDLVDAVPERSELSFPDDAPTLIRQLASAAPVRMPSGHQDPASARPEESSKDGAAVTLGPYRVLASIGRGGMGEIYLARCTSGKHRGKLVALKVLGTKEEDNEEALDMLMDEAAIMARIDDPHVLRVLDFGEASGLYFLATEYLEGRPLARVMIEAYRKKEGLQYGAVAAIGADAALGLFAAHTACAKDGQPLSVVHRDVSPQNIFVTYAGITKVIDFGVAQASERITSTQSGYVKGKAAYMSPEQAEGRTVDARSDVFSLGVCLWEMSAGRRLFRRKKGDNPLVSLAKGPIESPTTVRGDLHPVLDHIILGALERDREKRIQTSRDFAAQLIDFVEHLNIEDRSLVVKELMSDLFGSAAIKERSLIASLLEREPTRDEARHLRSLSGVASEASPIDITLNADEENTPGVPYEPSWVFKSRPGSDHPITREMVLDSVRRLQRERLDRASSADDPSSRSPRMDRADTKLPTHDVSSGPGSDSRKAPAVGGPDQPSPMATKAPEQTLVLAKGGATRVPGPHETSPSLPSHDPIQRSPSRLWVSLVALMLVGAGAFWWFKHGGSLKGPEPASSRSDAVKDPKVKPKAPVATLPTGRSPLVADVALGPWRTPQSGLGKRAAPSAIDSPHGGSSVLDSGDGVPSPLASDRATLHSEASALPDAWEGSPPALVSDRAVAQDSGVSALPDKGGELQPALVSGRSGERSEAHPLSDAGGMSPSALNGGGGSSSALDDGHSMARTDSVSGSGATGETFGSGLMKKMKRHGVDVLASGQSYLLTDSMGGTVVTREGARGYQVTIGSLSGWLLELSAPSLTSINWVGGETKGSWRVRALSINDCPATVRIEGDAFMLKYKTSEVKLLASGAVLTDLSAARPAFATRLVVEPLGISFAASDRETASCRVGWWGNRVVVRRLPLGAYTFRWFGRGREEAQTVRVSAHEVSGATRLKVSRE